MTTLSFPRLLLTLLAIFVLSGISASATEPVADATLPNGLHVVTAISHTVPIVAIDIWLRAGMRRQSLDQPGVAHFLEHLIYKGTNLRPEQSQVDAAVESLGGSLNAATSDDWAHYYTVVPSANFAAAMSVMADSLQHPLLSDVGVDGERNVIAGEIARDEDDPEDAMTEELHLLAYGNNQAYGRPVMGHPSDIQAVTHDQIKAFYNQFYVPNNATVVVSGDIDPQRAQDAVTDDFGSWKQSADLPDDKSKSVPVTGPIRRAVLRRGTSGSYLMMAFAAPSVMDKPDAWGMDVLLTLLGQGGDNRLDNLLHLKLHLVTSITADYLTQKDPGILTITAQFPTGDPDVVEKAILAEISRLRDQRVSAAELDSAKAQLASSYLFDTQTVSGKADALGFYDTIDSFKYDVDYVANFMSVTPDDLQRVALKYLTPDDYSVVTVVPPIDAMNATALGTGSSTVLVSRAP